MGVFLRAVPAVDSGSRSRKRSMMPMDFLISPEGAWFVANSAEANARIGYDDPDFDAAGFAVRNQGFIQVTFDGPASVRIRLHPQQAALGALNSLAERSATFGAAPVELLYLTDRWISERFPGIEEA